MASEIPLEPAPKRQKITHTKAWEDIGADEFVSLRDLYTGPQVKIAVQDKIYDLPKGLICHWSPVFNAAFNSTFKEGQEQAMTLVEASADAFEIIIRWMYLGTVVLPSTIQDDGAKITSLVACIRLAHFLDLPNFLAWPLDQIKVILTRSRDNLLSEHLYDAFELPTDHFLPAMLTKACIRPYMESLKEENRRKPFKYHKVLMEVGDFASYFHELFDKAMREGVSEKVYDQYYNTMKKVTFMDPFTETKFRCEERLV